jgi:flagellar motor switch protein FliM
MSRNDVLSQDEIDALLHGVDSDAVNTAAQELSAGEARGCDFVNQARIVPGRMPTLADADEDLLRRPFGGVAHALA